MAPVSQILYPLFATVLHVDTCWLRRGSPGGEVK